MIINIDPEFNPVKSDTDLEIFDFPSGCEPHVKIKNSFGLVFSDPCYITCRIKTSSDLIRLLLVTDAAKRMGSKNISVYIPYVPFARQDRVMSKGEPLSIKVFSELINSQNYSEVTIFDPHSDVASALINNCNVLSQSFFIKNIPLCIESNYWISPDAGSLKKIYATAKDCGFKGSIVECSKKRDVLTGKITSTFCPEKDFKGSDVYILDDICDGGFTFTELAKVLREKNCGKINLVVSHGIFSKGIDALGGIDHVYTTNSFCSIKHEKLTIINL